MRDEKPPSTPEELEAALTGLDADTAAEHLTILTGVAVSGVKTEESPEARERVELALAYGGKLVDLCSFVCDPSIIRGAMVLYRRGHDVSSIALYELDAEVSKVFRANGLTSDSPERWLLSSKSRQIN